MVDFVNPVALLTLGITLAAFTALWLVSVAIKNAAVVDVYWAAGFVVVAGVTFASASPDSATTSGAVLLAVCVWGVRLQAHLAWRFFRDAHEDARYAKFRADAGPTWWLRSLPQVFWLQAVLLWLVATPIHAAMLASAGSSLLVVTLLGAVLFLAGFVLEAVADWQLARFRSNLLNAGRTLRTGVWAWSRRPNYVGEALVWIGIGLMAVGGGAPWWALAGPALLIALLFGVTGPLTEQHLARAKRDYAEYAREVPLIATRPKSQMREPAE